MKILIDMNLSPDWVLVFAKYSIDSEKPGFLILRDRTFPRNQVSPITSASHRNIEEETRFLDLRDRTFPRNQVST